MTTGSVLYLAMCLAMFGVFSVVLAYHSWQQGRMGPEMLSTPANQPEPGHAVTA
ncbi:MAG: hypothetical protein P4L90_14085 [Rhodopila sp.]|nr:hypothetical protein [Rhodopila sp.]